MNLSEYHHLFLGLSTFESLPQREQGIAFDLAGRGAKVDFVEIVPALAGLFRRQFDRLFRRSAVDSRRFTKPLPEGFHIHIPPRVPTSFRNSVTPFYDRFAFRSWFRRTFRNQPWDRTIVWNMFPLWWKWYLDRDFINPRLVIYDIADDLSVFCSSSYAMNRMQAAETLLAKEADLVTFSAREMRGDIERRLPGKEAVFLPNAMSDLFIAVANEQAGNAADTKKIIGFVGFLSEKWIDTELLLQVAERYSDCTVSIIGPMQKGLAERFQQYANVSMTGFVDQERAVEYMKTFDVALIPFRQNEITRVVNPLKLYEYAAAGLPIVTISTDELQHYSEFLYLSASREEFLGNIEIALRDNSPSSIAARKAFALRHTWHSRIDDFQSAIHENTFLPGKGE